MPGFAPVEVEYRGRIVRGDWHVESGIIHVTSSMGCLSAPLRTLIRTDGAPSDLAKDLLWRLARNADPKRPFFYWR